MNYDVIFTIVNRGYADMVMDAAKSKGARGGTIINARGTASSTEKFFNISITPEKEVVMIVVDREIRRVIMEEITSRVGLKTVGQGIAFALPVNDTVGFREEKIIETKTEEENINTCE